MTAPDPVLDGPRPTCGARNRQGTPCQLAPGWGTPHPGVGRCKLHGGSSPSGIQNAQGLIAHAEARRFALPLEVDPSTALLGEVHRTAGWVAWLERRVDTDGEHALFTPTINGDAPGPWLALLNEQRKHLAAVCAAAIRAGVEERRVKLAERQGDAVVGLIRGILDDLALSAEQRAMVPDVVPRHLRSLDAAS